MITVIGIVTDDPRLDPVLRSLARDVVDECTPDQALHELEDAIKQAFTKAEPVQPVEASPEDWVSEETPAESNISVTVELPQPSVLAEARDKALDFARGFIQSSIEGISTDEQPPTETEKTEGGLLCVVCGNPVPKGKRTPTCSKQCYMKNYWDTHKPASGNQAASSASPAQTQASQARPRKKRGIKHHAEDRTGDGVIHGRLNLGRG